MSDLYMFRYIKHQFLTGRFALIGIYRGIRAQFAVAAGGQNTHCAENLEASPGYMIKQKRKVEMLNQTEKTLTNWQPLGTQANQIDLS